MPSRAAAAAPPPLTEPVEDYLKAIYELETRTGAAATSDVALALNVAPASVTGMIRRLAAQGFVDHEPYRGVQLTPLGRARRFAQFGVTASSRRISRVCSAIRGTRCTMRPSGSNMRRPTI